MPAFPLLLIEGLFYIHPHSKQLTVQTSKENVSLEPALKPYVGFEASVSICYLPPNPPIVEIPGFGCCALPDSCPTHLKDSSFLFESFRDGILHQDAEGNFSLGGSPLDFSKMLGHFGRLVLFSETNPRQDPELEKLSGQVEALSDLLKALNREIS